MKSKGIAFTGFLGCVAVALALLVPGVASAHPADDSNGDGPSQDDGGSTTPPFGGPDVGGGGVGQVPDRPEQPAEEPGGDRPDPSGNGNDQGHVTPPTGSAVTEPGAVKTPTSAGTEASGGRGVGSGRGVRQDLPRRGVRQDLPRGVRQDLRGGASARTSRGDAAAESLQAAGPGKAGPKPDERHPPATAVAGELDGRASVAPAAAPGEGGVAPYLWIALAALCASGLGAAGWFALALVRRRPRPPDVDDFPQVGESRGIEAELQAMLAEEALLAEERARKEQAPEEDRLPV